MPSLQEPRFHRLLSERLKRPNLHAVAAALGKPCDPNRPLPVTAPMAPPVMPKRSAQSRQLL
jgi:hypothetical protein